MVAIGGTPLQEKLGICAASLLTFLLGISVRGDWLLFLTGVWKHYQEGNYPNDNNNATSPPDVAISPGFSLENYYLKNIFLMLVVSISMSYLTFFGMAGYFHHHFYTKRRDRPQEWKCQPDKFLTAANERHAFISGGVNMTIGAIYSGTLACYIVNGGPTMLYYSISDYGLPYLLCSTAAFFLMTDGIAYYTHKACHWPIIYKNIHKWHHRYQQPIVYTAVAMHPIEFMTFQFILAIPIFIIPVHVFIFLGIVLYNYYYGIVDHSGIKMDAFWPWQPASTFHDNHHKLFHVNFGFNTKIFDWYHGTLERSDRRYGEDIFGGKGTPMTKVD
ncbi:lathosterol oxidase-like [Lineus longissimus]|uniref:lathosterol oxidase-like n=1 Tax=Lineus longissimus TaxID=88925 RepID=UPI002B4DD777